MGATMTWQAEYLARFYDPARGWVDGTQEFHDLCANAIPRGSRILEMGPGPSNRTSRFLATLGELHGLDPDPDARQNDALAGFELLDGPRFPFPDASFAACVSNYVVEHVADAEAHLAEVARILSPGGVYVFRTPNRWHYVTMFASLTPHWVHELLANRLRALPDDEHDPYPTVYALNTRPAVEHHAARAGFRVETLRLVEKEPSYGMAARPLFLAFMAYERAVNATERAAFLRSNIFAVLRKAASH
jgi:SAM-dependent methyltransferase